MSDISSILTAIGQASYVWDVKNDTLSWSDNFAKLVGIKPDVDTQSGRDFDKLLSSESQETRFAAIHSNIPEKVDKRGYVYQCVYALSAEFLDGNNSVWLEDTGRWYPDKAGKPVRAEGVVRIINERRNREENLRRKSEYDDLTGLPNRRYLQETIAQTAKKGMVDSKSSAFMVLALCDFERINAIYGFSIGDEILTKVAGMLSDWMRDGDLVARFSGAKFGVILKDCQSDEVYIAARRVLDSINDRILMTSSGPVAMKVAVGACLLPRHARTALDAVSAATDALDKARHERGLKVHVHEPDPAITEKREADSKLLKRFVGAFESGAMHLAYQPIVNAITQRPDYHEALLRMDKGDDGVIEDASFIRLAEDLGLIRLVDIRALNLALETLETCPDARISLNITHESLEYDEWIETLSNRLSGIENGAERLIIEVVESQLPKDIEETKKSIGRIRATGCKVAIDDFGAGYTSFSHLKELDVDIVKIDGSFCRGLKEDPRNGIFLQTMQKLASTFDVTTVVEWVEDVETASLLQEWGFDYLQGGLYGMPLALLPWEQKLSDEESETATKNQA